MTGFARLATPIAPIMDNMRLDTQFFAVPIRLLWDNWEKFNGAQDNPGDSTDYLVPTMTSPASTGYDELTIHDHFGIPPKIPKYCMEICRPGQKADRRGKKKDRIGGDRQPAITLVSRSG